MSVYWVLYMDHCDADTPLDAAEQIVRRMQDKDFNTRLRVLGPKGLKLIIVDRGGVARMPDEDKD